MGIKGFVLSAVAAAMMFSTGCAKQTRLFNGRDFTGWKMHVDDPSVDVNTVWTVKDGVIHCAGKPNGYIRTTSEYSDYKLHVEWRWPEEPTNSGVLLHASGKDQVWPRCIEAQLNTTVPETSSSSVTRHHRKRRTHTERRKMFVSFAKKFESTERNPASGTAMTSTARMTRSCFTSTAAFRTPAARPPETSGWILPPERRLTDQFHNIYLERLK